MMGFSLGRPHKIMMTRTVSATHKVSSKRSNSVLDVSSIPLSLWVFHALCWAERRERRLSGHLEYLSIAIIIKLFSPLISIIISSFCDFAIGHDGYIVTNDQYRDHVRSFEGAEREQQKTWAKSRLVSFTFVGDEFLPNPMKNIRWRATSQVLRALKQWHCHGPGTWLEARFCWVTCTRVLFWLHVTMSRYYLWRLPFVRLGTEEHNTALLLSSKAQERALHCLVSAFHYHLCLWNIFEVGTLCWCWHYFVWTIRLPMCVRMYIQ